MKSKLNKVWPLLATSLVALTSTVSAVDDMQMRNLENRVNALEQRRGANGMVNPPARPVVKDGTDLWIQADALFMQPTEDGLAFGIKNENVNAPFDGSVKNVSYDWSWGFRAGIGYNLPHDGWDMLLNWTWLYAHETKDEKVEGNEVIYQTLTNPTSSLASVNAISAKGKAHLHYNVLDLEIGREFFVSKWLTLRPFMGARGTWLHRTFPVKYKDALREEIEINLNNRFRGGGVRGGLDTQWGVGCGWSFYGQASISLIYGVQRLHEKQDAETIGGAETRLLHVSDHWTMGRPMTDLAFGLRWDHLFYDDQYRIRFQFGWEQHQVIGFDKDINFVDNTVQGKYTFNQGDLALSGVSFQARFDF